MNRAVSSQPQKETCRLELERLILRATVRGKIRRYGKVRPDIFAFSTSAFEQRTCVRGMESTEEQCHRSDSNTEGEVRRVHGHSSQRGYQQIIDYVNKIQGCVEVNPTGLEVVSSEAR